LRALQDTRLEPRKTLEPRKIAKPPVDLLSSVLPAQSASEKALTSVEKRLVNPETRLGTLFQVSQNSFHSCPMHNSWSIPFPFGCHSVAEFLDELAFVVLDLQYLLQLL
jgi:hypothetical protein